MMLYKKLYGLTYIKIKENVMIVEHTSHEVQKDGLVLNVKMVLANFSLS